jgi:hypothetical protein
MASVFVLIHGVSLDLVSWGQSLVSFLGFSLWSYSIWSVFVLIPWDQYMGFWSYSMGSVFGIIPCSQSLVLFHAVSLWSYSMASVVVLIPWVQSLDFFHGVSLGIIS